MPVPRITLFMSVPAYQIKDDIQKYGISVFSSNYTLYGDMSGRVMSILAEQVPEMEVYSIDEAFLNLEGIRDIQSLGTDIINKVSEPGIVQLTPSESKDIISVRLGVTALSMSYKN